MIDFSTRLLPLMQKEPIVSTFDSSTLVNQPKEVIVSYDQHAATYIDLDSLRDLEQRFIDKIITHQTPKACLVARYGYGKTTASIGLWQACRKVGVLAVPPAGYTSMTEIAIAVYSWTRAALNGNINALARLNELYHAHLQSSTEELARLVSRRSGRSYDQVLEVLTDPALEGNLKLDPPTSNIVLFLEELTLLISANGYTGIAVFVDEFQQLLGKAGADILTSLRSLVWGLRTRKIPFGLVITMDPNSERILGERAGDILHRIKDDDLYLDFRQIYSSDFPRLLWERYARQLRLDGITFSIVDKPTLEALGQICERADLSNGPRTVANAFRRIASYYASTQKTYTPLQLIDDFLTGAITFDGDASTIASLVTEFAGYAYFKRTDSHLMALKLLVAFPNGCPIEFAERYGVLEAFKEIISELRGDIVTLLPKGYALIDLQRVGKPLDRLSLILKKYWMQITDTEFDPDENARRFAQYVVPLLFPTNTNQIESWKAESALSLSADDTYIQMFTGYLHTRHPLRYIQVVVCKEEIPSIHSNENVDLTLVFVLYNNPTNEQKAYRGQGNCLFFHLNLGKFPKDGLPADLRIVEHNLSPQPSTPAVLLNVIEFVEREASLTTLTQSEYTKVNRTLENMRRWLLNSIFDDQLLGSVDSETATPGYRGIRDLLFRECERRFPNYHTLITSSVWKDNLTLYKNILSTRTLGERRGIEPIKGSKEAIATLFKQRSHAGFESKIRVQYPNLIEMTWAGEQGILWFIPHSMETRVLTSLGDGGCSLEKVIAIGRTEGYAEEEIEEILSLLLTRGQIKEDANFIHKVDTISVPELQRLGKEFVTELQALKEASSIDNISEELQIANSLAELDTSDNTDRELAHSRLVSLTGRMGLLRTKARSNFIQLLERQRSEIAKLLQNLDKSLPVFSSAVSFKNHLEGARKHLEENATSMQRTATRLGEAIQTTRNQLGMLQDAEIGSFLSKAAIMVQQRDKALYELKERVKLHLHNVELLRQWRIWSESFVRLQHNVTSLVAQLEGAELVSIQLAGMLDAIENDVRESLAQQGLVALEEIDAVQHRLEEVAKEYERNISEREKAFEHEKFELEALVSLITNRKSRLRGKYQISKHEDSYKDLYIEAIEVAQEVTGSLADRAELIEAHIQSHGKVKEQSHKAPIDRRAIKTLLQKIAEGQNNFSTVQMNSVMSRHKWREDFFENLIKLKRQLDEMEIALPTQIALPIATAPIISKLTSQNQNLSSLINVETAIADLPAESEIAALLRLCLCGDVVIEVRRKKGFE